MKIMILYSGILLSYSLPVARRARSLAERAGLYALILPHPRQPGEWFVFLGRSWLAGFVFRHLDRGF